MVLTSSSSRVRETLCQDGGLERLVQIMKEDHVPEDQLAPFKWHLCMQCLLNLGARGSEHVRMRVLEAGAIPVIATVLDNYLVAHGDSLEHRDHDRMRKQRQLPNSASRSQSSSFTAAPSLVTSSTSMNTNTNNEESSTQASDSFPFQLPILSSSSALFDPYTSSESSAEPRMAPHAEHFLSQFSQATGRPVQSRRSQHANLDPTTEGLTTEGLTTEGLTTQDMTGRVPNQDGESTINPTGLMTTTELVNAADMVNNSAVGVSGLQLQPRSPGSMELDQSGTAQFVNGLLVPREQDVFWALEIIAFVSKYSHLRREMQETHFLPQLSLRPQEELFANDSASEIGVKEDEMEDVCQEQTDPQNYPGDDDLHEQENNEQNDDLGAMHVEYEDNCDHQHNHNHSHSHSHNSFSSHLDQVAFYEAALNYVASKPGLPTTIDEAERAYYSYDFENNVDFDDEFLTRSINLFELVERFTAFRAPREFPHWACIIMRNFVRKDEGGIRQCANFSCGKWEEYPRQFAKCRRCKRTKYCSKACQLKAWSMHRYWCAPSQSSSQSQQAAHQITTDGSSQSDSVQHQLSLQLPGQQHGLRPRIELNPQMLPEIDISHRHHQHRLQQQQLLLRQQQEPEQQEHNQDPHNNTLNRHQNHHNSDDRSRHPYVPQPGMNLPVIGQQSDELHQETLPHPQPLPPALNVDYEIEAHVDSPQSSSIAFVN